MKNGFRIRIIASMAGLVLLVGLLGSLFSIVIGYAVEDEIFSRLLTKEAKALYSPNTQPAAQHFIRTFSQANLPVEIKSALLERLNEQPARDRFEVFASNGKHFHLQKLKLDTDQHDSAGSYWLVAEVSDLLAMRPMRAGLTQLLVLFNLGGVIIAVIVGALIGWRLTRPIAKLAAVTQQLNLESAEILLPYQERKDEVGQLSGALNDALARVKQFIDTEKGFSRDASHELRTPVAVIKSSLELLDTDPSSDKGNNALLINRIKEACLSMEQTMSSLLSLSKSKKETSKPVNLNALLERSVVDQSVWLTEKSVSVELNTRGTKKIIAAEGVLKIVLDNLISNAFRYSQAGQVTIDASDSQVTISNPYAHDTASTELDNAVMPAKTISEGYGLGLSITQRICEQYGWQLNSSVSNSEYAVTLTF